MDRGMTSETIDGAMAKMIGKDWRVLSVETWIKRLKDEGYIPEEVTALSVDDLDALITGCIKLDQIQ